MKVEEFQNLTDDQLRERANACLAVVDNPSFFEVHAAKLLESQLYMGEISRRKDDSVAARDFLLEVSVIGLIGIEIVLSIVGLWYGIHEGNKQKDILRSLNTSADATARTSAAQAEALPKLVDEQKRSMSSLSDMNDKLKDSLKQTTTMAAAMQKQVKILQDEQAARQAELAKKPKLELYVEDVPLTSLSSGLNFKVREATETKLTFDVALKNSGDATANKGVVRVIVDVADVSITASLPFQPIPEAQKDEPQHGVLIPFEYIRSGARVVWTVSFTYPTGQQPFSVYFNVDADEVPTGTPLGSMLARPLKP